MMGKAGKRWIILLVLATAIVLVLTPMGSAEEEEGLIYLKGMDPNQTNIPYDLLKNFYLPGEVGPYIISFTGPVQEDYKIQVASLGVQLVEFIPDFSFLVNMTPELAAQVQNLSFISQVQLYQPAYKVPPALKDEYGNLLINQNVVVDIFSFGQDLIQIKNVIINAGGQVLSEGTDHVVAQLYSHQLGSLAQLNSVKFIEVVPQYELLNDVAKGIMKVGELWNLGYEGENQVVAVCDTGLDTGINDSSMHLDFQGRIDAIYALGRPGNASDPHGHGTHVTGSVLGSGAGLNGAVKGMAPKAHLVFQSILDSAGGLGGIPTDLNILFQQAWNAGARIHTNSWGAAVHGDYNSKACDVDEFVWANDMIILFAAGNSGSADNTICSPGSAKNCITVGASENYRPIYGWSADNANEVAYFSSRGWTEDGRIKPDVVAPGTWVLSTRSSLAPDSHYWGPYPNDNRYAYMGGTSMATPLTAGAVAVARQYIQKMWGRVPSPAMMKAVLINGATDMGYGVPSRGQGWGRINLYNSLVANMYRYIDETYSITTNQRRRMTYDVDSEKTPFKVTLVWTDYPGSITASKALVNDLDLKVTTPSGAVYYGNWLIPVSPFLKIKSDHKNNVENVIIKTPEVGTYKVEVIGYNVPQGPQPFALYATADYSTWFDDHVAPTCFLSTPLDGATISGLVTLSVKASDAIGISRVEFYVDGIKVGTDSISPYSYSWDSNSVSNGSHVIQAKAIDPSGNIGSSSSHTVNVAN